VEEKIKFLFGRTKDIVAEEELQEILNKIFMPKKMHNRGEELKKVIKNRDEEARNKNLHMNYETHDSMWKEMSAIVCNKSSKFFFDWLTAKLYKDKEKEKEKKRELMAKLAREEMLNNPSLDKMHKLRNM
jgi:hypothetical protein